MMAKRILITSDTFGSADAVLGRVLMQSFLTALAHEEQRPLAVMLVNEGVRLACTGSESLDALLRLRDAGVMVRACTTCLKHFDLLDRLEAAEASNMPSLVAAVCGPDEIVTIG